MSRKEGRRRLSLKIASIHPHDVSKSAKKSKERPITATRNNTDNIRINKTTITKKQKWEEKQQYGYFKQQTSEMSYIKTWTWLRKRTLKRETEITSNSSTKQLHKDQLC